MLLKRFFNLFFKRFLNALYWHALRANIHGASRASLFSPVYSLAQISACNSSSL
jgi:hypothetical protein